MTRLYLLVLDNTTWDEAAAARLLQPSRQADIARLKSPAARMRSLCGEMLVRYLLAESLDVALEEIAIEREKGGKPYLTGRQDVHFSLSHSGNAVACAISDAPVGCDIEQVGKHRPNIARRHFTGKEQAWIEEGDRDRDRRFFAVWTGKEAYLKRIGVGLTQPLNAFDVLEERSITHFYRDGYAIAVCASDVVNGLCLVPPEEIVKFIKKQK